MNSLQLKRLEAYGFKSFADRITIAFDRGVTAVVGPNGSGKSNITDAIRWALGEQNVRNLRGLKTEDIIFTGSSSRRALGVAEVTLTFLNEGDLPVNFTEVVITRRIFRSGDSEFYINKSRCRLKDIHGLLADTGLGHDGLSVISQNKIDEILNSRPEERRLFFEETAGITKYRDRKRDSVRKLDAAQQNLVRVADIQREIENQLTPMAEEAKRTRQYQVWQGEFRRCRITELYRSQERASRGEAAAREKISAGQVEAAAADAKVQSLEAQKALLAKDVLDLEQQLLLKNEAKNRLREAAEAAQSEIRVMEERRQQGDANQRRLGEQLKELQQEQAAAQAERTALLTVERERQEEAAAAAAQVTAEKEKAAVLGQKIREKKAALEQLHGQREQAQREALTKENELKLLEHDIEAGHTERAQKNQAAEQLEKSLAEGRQELAALGQRLTAKEQEAAALLRTQQAAGERRRRAEASLRPRQQAIRMVQQYMEQAQGKLGVLQEMQASYEGFGRAAKAVLMAKEPWRQKVCGAVAELLEIPAKYLVAIEVALGASQQNIVTEDTETAKQIIAYLKRIRAGRVTFLPLAVLESRTAPDLTVKGMSGVIGYANEVVQSEAKYRRVIDFLLARTLLVDTLDRALRVAEKYRQRLRIVTLEGEMLNPGGSITGGSLQQRESGFLNRGGEIEALKAVLEEKKRALERDEALYEEAIKEKAALEEQMEKDQQRLQEVRIQAAEVRVAKERLAERVQEEEIRLDAMKALAEQQADSFAKAQQRRGEVIRNLQALRLRALDVQKNLAEEQGWLDDLEQDAEDFRKWLTKLEMQAAALGQEAGHSRQLVLLKEKELLRLEEAIRGNRQEAEGLASGLKDGGEKIEALRLAGQEKQAAHGLMEKECQALYREKMEKLSQGQESEAAARSARQALARLQEKLHQLELERSKLQFTMEQSVTVLRDEFSLTPAKAAEEALDVSDKALQEAMKRLTDDLAALGAVNIHAVTEYDRLRERYDFMAEQARDLTEAKENLLRIIKDMDAAMTKQFKAAFAAIRQHFNEIFQELFGGGEAELRLTDETRVLEAGVEIDVQLPEKKRQNLSVLSGGERALTVIALLFAFLRVRPAPFSVLDEIDAPLDEANIVRFGKFLREFSRETQFVIVTHRKGTMAAADTMYGVTLEDAGVSKLISVKLDDLAKDERG